MSKDSINPALLQKLQATLHKLPPAEQQRIGKMLAEHLATKEIGRAHV